MRVYWEKHSIWQWFSNFDAHQNHLEDFLKHRLWHFCHIPRGLLMLLIQRPFFEISSCRRTWVSAELVHRKTVCTLWEDKPYSRTHGMSWDLAGSSTTPIPHPSGLGNKYIWLFTFHFEIKLIPGSILCFQISLFPLYFWLGIFCCLLCILVRRA